MVAGVASCRHSRYTRKGWTNVRRVTSTSITFTWRGRRSEAKPRDADGPHHQQRDQYSAWFISCFHSDTMVSLGKDHQLFFTLPDGVGWGRDIMPVSQAKKQRPGEHSMTCSRSCGNTQFLSIK